MAQASKLDTVYRSILLSKFFTKGWGKPNNLKRLFDFRKIMSDREKCRHLVDSNYPIEIDKVEKYPDYHILNGHFLSPFVKYVPEVVPEESEIARFQVLLPNEWLSDTLRPVCIHLAGTGDHYFWRRRMLIGRPLLKEAKVASILLENPFYGVRKPKSQVRSNLHNVSDIFVMGGCLILETIALLHWCEREGFGPLGITGISMGGHMASIAGTNWHKPISLIPCLSWTTASCVFTQGVMSGAIPWHLLESQYFSEYLYEDEIKQMVHSPEQNEAFMAGYHFARTYSKSIDKFHPSSDFSTDAASASHSNINCSLENSNSNFKTVSSSRGTSQPSTTMKNSSVNNLRYTNHQISDQQRKNSEWNNSISKVEALNFMRGIMDEFTHLENFSVPVDTSLVIAVAAKHDAYVPREGIKSLPELWPNTEVRYIDCGHIAAFLFNQGSFRRAIIDSLDMNAQKYYGRNIFTRAPPLSPKNVKKRHT